MALCECFHRIPNLVEVFSMKRTIANRLVCWMALISLAVVFAAAEQPVLGAEGRAPVKKRWAEKAAACHRTMPRLSMRTTRGNLQDTRGVSAEDRLAPEAARRAEERVKRENLGRAYRGTEEADRRGCDQGQGKPQIQEGSAGH